MLAERILSVQRSPFYSIMDLAVKRGDCIYLHLGEPDFTPTRHIVEAAKKAQTFSLGALTVNFSSISISFPPLNPLA